MRFGNLCFAALTLALAALVGTAADAARAPKKSCTLHADCGSPNEYCQYGKCQPLSVEESFLGVGLEQGVAFPAYLYIDGVMMGTLPWEGIVAPGPHTIRVDCEGMTPVEFQGTSTPGAVDYIPIRLVPLPQPASGAPTGGGQGDGGEGSGERGVPGTLRLGLGIGIGYGTAIGSPDWRRPVVTLLGGGSFGLRVVTKPVWLEVGFAVTSTTLKIVDYGMDTDGDGDDDRWMRFGDFLKLDLGLQFRLLFPVKENLFYLGAEFSPGAGISNHNYVYGDLFFTMSVFPHELFEIFINPVGVDYLQELATSNASYIVSYKATLGVALRFPKKPLF